MSLETQRAVEQLINSKSARIAIAASGAGAGLQEILWSVPGISSVLEEAIFPYSEVAIRRFVQRPLGRMLHQESAVALAVAAFLRSQEGALRAKLNLKPIGLGISAAVPTNRTRRGAEEVYIALRDSTSIQCAQISFERGQLNRKEMGHLCDMFGLNAILSWAGFEQVELKLKQNSSHGDLEVSNGKIKLRKLEYLPQNHPEDFVIDEQGAIRAPQEILTKRHLLLPSSLNPFHFGHDNLALRAIEETGRPVIFELSLSNVDKAKLDVKTALDRAIQLRGRWPLLVTNNAALFIQKAQRYGCSFIVGLDTAERTVDASARYNDGRPNLQVLEELDHLGIKFYVAERGNERNVSSLSSALPPHLKNLFLRLTGKWEVSSSELRKSL